MGLEQLDLSKFEISKPPPKESSCELVMIRRISTGEDILLTTIDPAPEEALAESIRMALPLFTARECETMKQAGLDHAAIQKIIDIKMVMPGSTVARFRKAN